MVGGKNKRFAPGAATGILLILGALVLSGCLPGEWAADVYVGPNFAVDENLDINVLGGTLVGDGDFEGNMTIGARVGHWFTVLPLLDLGMYTDISGILFKVNDTNINSIPLSPLLMARLPLFKSDATPFGRLQPYVGAGPSLVISGIDDEDFTDTSVDFGVDARAGVTFMIAKPIGVFGEYRFTYFDPSFSTDTFLGEVEVGGNAFVHHALFGVTVRF